jgi:hypothetical protein
MLRERHLSRSELRFTAAAAARRSYSAASRLDLMRFRLHNLTGARRTAMSLHASSYKADEQRREKAALLNVDTAAAAECTISFYVVLLFVLQLLQYTQ